MAYSTECSAIIGMACRVAGAKSPNKLWENILNKIDLQRPIPTDRFNIDGFYHPNGQNKGTTSVKDGYFIDERIDAFDANFFGISGKEAEAMDPQQRLVLELVYEALEDAGISLDTISGTQTSVFVGSFTNDYALMTARDMDDYPRYAVNGTSNAIISNRVSFFYNLHGASVTVDTACSASLVGFHLGNQSLLTGEADYSIIVGSALNFIPNTWQVMTDLGLLSSDGRCRAFDAKGHGYVRGDGVCAVVLRRLRDSQQCGDRVRAIVRATAINHDGTKSAIGLPSAESQERLIRSTYRKAGLDPDDTQFFEAHGTGTRAGDPREAKAIGAVFGTSTRQKNLFLGSVKTNVGHLEGAAGLIGIIKTTLALENGKIPPNMWFEDPNPEILFDEWKLVVPTSESDWDMNKTGSRRASINSFGYGGANAHVILESHPAPVQMPLVNSIRTRAERGQTEEPRPYLIPFSAHCQNSLDALRQAISDYSRKRPDLQLRDLAYSLSHRRTIQQIRSFVVASTLDETMERLTDLSSTPTILSASSTSIGFVFTGQGAQYSSMGCQLIEQSQSFRRTLQRADEVLQSLHPQDRPTWSIFTELQRSQATSQLSQSQLSQPICTAVQLALVDLLSLWNIHPSIVCGHSSGEIAAAYTAGLLSFESAMVVAYYRGLHMSRSSRAGAMAALGLGEAQANAMIQNYHSRVSVAAVNSSGSVTLSGDEGAIMEILERLPKSIFARKLRVEQAFHHSNHMEPLAGDYKKSLEKCGLFDCSASQRPVCPMVSSVTGEVVRPKQLDALYWAVNMVRQVRFADALEYLIQADDEDLSSGVDLLLEVGPHPALSGPSRQVMTALRKTLPYFATLHREKSAFESLLENAGRLFVQGYPVNLAAVNQDQMELNDGLTASRLYDLPSYPWDHKHYWSATRLIKEHLHRPVRHTLLGSAIPGSTVSRPRWKNSLRLSEIPWLKEHVFDGKALFPGAGYISMAIEAVLRTGVDLDKGNISSVSLKDVNIKRPLELTDSEKGSEILLELSPVRTSSKTTSETWFDFSISSYIESERFSENCTGAISVQFGIPSHLRPSKQRPAIAALRRKAFRRAKATTLYSQINESGLFLGERFQLINKLIFCGQDFVVASVSTRPDLYTTHELSEGTMIHATLLDTCFQSMFYGIETAMGKRLDKVFVPTFIKSLRLSSHFSETNVQSRPKHFTIANFVQVPTSRTAVSDVSFYETAGESLMMEIQGLEMTTLGSANAFASTRPLFFCQKFRPCFDLFNWQAAPESLRLEDIMKLYQFQHPGSKILVLPFPGDMTFPLIRLLIGGADDRPQFDFIHIAVAHMDEIETLDELCNREDDRISICKPNALYDLVLWQSSDIPFSTIEPFLHQDSVICSSVSLTGLCDWNCIFQHHSVTLLRRSQLRETEANQLTIVEGLSNADCHTVTLCESLKSAGYCVTVTQLSVLPGAKISEAFMVVTATLGMSIDDPSTWARVRYLLTLEDKTIVWLLQGAFMDCFDPEQAKILGLLRVARNENTRSRFIAIDTDVDTSPSIVAQRILQALSPNLAEEDLIDRGGTVYIHRVLENSSLNRSLPDSQLKPHFQRFASCPPLTLKISKPALLETLHFTPDAAILSQHLAPHEVEIRVQASALNFRDVAATMGFVPDTQLGDECAGVIVQLGSSVSTHIFRIGQRVVACRPGQGAHATLVRQPADLCIAIPDAWKGSMVTAASWSGTLTTAVHALLNVARLRAGETLLVHSAAGGVGQMAVQIAKMVGARVLGTCSSEEKERVLMEQYGLEQGNLFSSRDDSFVDGVMEATEGKGADVVLNSLAGPLLQASWRCVAPFGRFIELGKRDIHQDALLPMGTFRKNVMFAAIDLVMIYEEAPELARRILDDSAELFFSGKIQSPYGCREFPYSQAEKAFRLLQQGKHIGKVVLVPNEDDMVAVMSSNTQLTDSRLFDPSKTYLLVGGLGGLGTILAEWMIRHGARNLTFFSRTGAAKSEAKETVEWLRSRDISVTVIKGDINCKADIKTCIESLHPGLGGIFFAAMALNDSLISNMTFSQWNHCVETKCVGAWNIHEATMTTDLDFYICFSSSSAIIGNKGQANYAAANAYLDALMAHRRQHGLTGSTMNIGAVAGTGTVIGDNEVDRTLRRMKHILINEHEFLRQLEETVLGSSASASARMNGSVDGCQTITGINVEEPDVFWATRSMFRNLYANRKYDAGSSSLTSGTLAAQLIHAATPEAKATLILRSFSEKVAAILGMSIDSIPPERSLSDFGIDSIVAVELRKWFKETADIDVTLFDVTGSKSMRSLVEKLCFVEAASN